MPIFPVTTPSTDYWQAVFLGGSPNRPTSNFAAQDEVPTSLLPCDAFDADTDETIWLEGVVPSGFNGNGTIKLDILACANTTTAADDARIDVATAFKTPGASEAMNSVTLDGTPDSGTMTFSTTAYSLQLLTVTLTPATTPAKGDWFRIGITRDANNGSSLDDLGVDLLGVAYRLYEVR